MLDLIENVNITASWAVYLDSELESSYARSYGHPIESDKLSCRITSPLHALS